MKNLPGRQSFVLLQKAKEVGHHFLGGGAHITLEGLHRTMAGEGHHVVGRVTALVEVSHTTASGGMETYHAPFGSCTQGRHTTPAFLVVYRCIDVTSLSQRFDDSIGRGFVQHREAMFAVVLHQRGNLFQYFSRFCVI